jgi:hypothetical protein
MLIAIGLRVTWFQPYDFLEGFKWNNENAVQVVGFLILSFNVLWVPFLAHLIKPSLFKGPENRLQDFILRSSPMAFIVIIGTTYLFGIFNEIRLLYLLSPWVITAALNWTINYEAQIKAQVVKSTSIIFGVMVFVAAAIAVYFVLRFQNKLLVPGKYEIPYSIWIIFSGVYFGFLLFFAPAIVKVLLGRK